MTDLILHHYDISPFAEKIRLLLGLKGLSWQSVVQPMVLPKPKLVPLTGGFRRIPVLQIGADVFCDTLLIAEEIDRRHPERPIYPDGDKSRALLLSTWAEQVLMWPTARYVTAVNSRHLTPAFHADRAAMRGHAPPSEETLRAGIPHFRRQVALQVSWIEGLLGDGRAYLTGAAPCLGDFAVYQRIWWLGAFDGAACDVLDPFAAVRAWSARMAAFGHGKRSERDPDSALDIARDTMPSTPPTSGGDIPAIGTAVTVGTENFCPDPVSGIVVAASPERISIRREDPRVGTVIVHFPRLGYEVRSSP